uniref:Uncharacterized protein n=1 Tax=Arundo donax TaxID=35708 RepID=A0A0A9AU79_ARUDO
MVVGPHSAVEATSSAASGCVAGTWCIGSRVRPSCAGKQIL